MYLEKYNLTGRRAVVTGGGRNIGLACAAALAESGAHVLISGRPESETAEEGRAVLARMGHEVDVVHFDVAQSGQVAEARRLIESDYGPVDILVCSAADLGGEPTPAEAVTDEEWESCIRVNVNGLFWTCREFGRSMLTRRYGSIVTVGSISGEIINRPQPQSAYNTSKAAVHHLTKSLAAEWADRGVRVNAVAPTYVDKPGGWGRDQPHLIGTWLDATPMHRQGTADEIASVVLFLACDASSLMTGAVVLADGGYTLW